MSQKTYKILFTIAVAIILLGIGAYVFSLREVDMGVLVTPIPTIDSEEEFNFTKTGYISDHEPQKVNEGMYFVYDEPGKPAQSLKLLFDGKSMCTFNERSTVCMALSITIDGVTKDERIFVEGIKNGNELLVRNIGIDRDANRK